ncbi:hypothetical protein CY34DRAFT_435645 [Suillus luteus UH-Slu-Lm8-n1]|uniref:Uncharacterized protein n=1 Tax=Suillus luteus UH-Slu-Lm8-n1 TaxID=930992 RepID=A0A0D0AG22_9AGAM|nr:hypothetical protein CY34DRAFT_435645 [Suillus luteus UH-Slu-Lm8-n1]
MLTTWPHQLMVCVFYGPSIPLLMRASIVKNKDLDVLLLSSVPEYCMAKNKPHLRLDIQLEPHEHFKLVTKSTTSHANRRNMPRCSDLSRSFDAIG